MRYSYAEEIKASLDIQEVAEYYGLEFNRSGYCRCPFHSEKTASFKIQNVRFAHCFGCGVNADSISLTMQLLRLDFYSATQRLNEDFRLGLDLGKKPNLRQQRTMQARYEERMRQEQANRAVDERIDTLEMIWCMYDRWRRQYMPKTPEEPFAPRYVTALREMDYIAHLIDEEEDRRWLSRGKKSI